jgi:hypothetical protein
MFLTCHTLCGRLNPQNNPYAIKKKNGDTDTSGNIPESFFLKKLEEVYYTRFPTTKILSWKE